MTQFHISFNYANFNIRLFVDFCVFTCFHQFLHDMIIKLFCINTKRFYDHIMQKVIKTGKYTEINKQSSLAELNKIWNCLIFIKLYIPSIFEKLYSLKASPFLTICHALYFKTTISLKRVDFWPKFWLFSRTLTAY